MRLSNVVDTVAWDRRRGRGRPAAVLAGGAFDDYSYERILGGCYDTDDNAHDCTPLADLATL